MARSRSIVSSIALLAITLVLGCSDTTGDGDSLSTCQGSSCDDEGIRSDRTRPGPGESSTTNEEGDDGLTEENDPNTGENDDTTTTPTEDPETNCGMGRVEGRVCAPDEQTWIGGAGITVAGTDCEGTAFSRDATSDPDGYFTIQNVPAGFHDLIVQMGSFEATYGIRVNDGQVSDFTAGQEKLCLSDDALEIAVLGGVYDSIENIVSSLGVEHDFYSDEGDPSAAQQLLLSSTRLGEYDIIFVNCGDQHIFFGWEADDPGTVHQQMADNLAQFVNNGGSLYVSDWTYWLIERAFPDAIEFSGDELDYERAFRGVSRDLTATIVDPTLAAALGQSTVDLEFATQGWVVPQAIAASSRVWVEADVRLLDDSTVRGAPLLISFRPGALSGTVFFTSFHNEAQLATDIERILQLVIFSL